MMQHTKKQENIFTIIKKDTNKKGADKMTDNLGKDLKKEILQEMEKEKQRVHDELVYIPKGAHTYIYKVKCEKPLGYITITIFARNEHIARKRACAKALEHPLALAQFITDNVELIASTRLQRWKISYYPQSYNGRIGVCYKTSYTARDAYLNFQKNLKYVDIIDSVSHIKEEEDIKQYPV